MVDKCSAPGGKSEGGPLPVLGGVVRRGLEEGVVEDVGSAASEAGAYSGFEEGAAVEGFGACLRYGGDISP